MSEPFRDVSAETAVVAGVVQFGRDAYVDCEGFVKPDDLTVDYNQVVLSCAAEHFSDGTERPLDYPTLISLGKRLGLSHVFDQPDFKRHLRTLRDFPVDLSSVRPEAARLLKLRVGRELYGVLSTSGKALKKITGDESLGHILGLVENPVFEYTSKLSGDSNDTKQMGDGIEEWLENAIEHPTENLGIPTPFPKFNTLIGGGFRRRGIAIVGARPKTGKAQTLSATVFTPSGPKRMGDVVVGDSVSTPDGKTANVVGVFPQGVRDVYRVTFSDGDTVEVDGEHLWEVSSRKGRHKVLTTKVLTTLEIAGDLYEYGTRPKWSVRLPALCHYHPREIDLDPYLLGYLVGNGSLTGRSVRFFAPDKETVDRIRAALGEGYKVNPHGPHGDYQIACLCPRSPLIRALRSLGLMGENAHHKFIPDAYKYNTEERRKQFLRGCLDADGGVSNKKSGNVEASTVSGRLAKDVKELVQSLGGLCKIVPRTTQCGGKTFPSFRLYIRTNDNSQLFVLSRKRELARARKKPPLRRTVRSVEKVGREPVQCIMLDSADHLYMTDHHIVTHNTVWCDNVALHVAGTLGIPVLNLDTEMTDEEHWARILGHLTGIPMERIEQGKVDAKEAKLLRQKAKWVKTIPYYYRSVIDESFEEQVAAMRRWVVKTVGTDEDGRRKDCLVVYDYLQLTDPGEFSGNNFKEYQLLGFQMVALSRMAKRYDVPVLSMLQLNRDGIDKETTAVAAGSDRIIWKCSNFSILKKKDPDADANFDAGNLKLINLIARHGEGGKPGDYINIKFEGATAKMTEGPTFFELQKGTAPSTEKPFDGDYDQQESYGMEPPWEPEEP